MGQTEDGVTICTCFHGQQRASGAHSAPLTGQILGGQHKLGKPSACYNRAWILRGQNRIKDLRWFHLGRRVLKNETGQGDRRAGGAQRLVNATPCSSGHREARNKRSSGSLSDRQALEKCSCPPERPEKVNRFCVFSIQPQWTELMRGDQ